MPDGVLLRISDEPHQAQRGLDPTGNEEPSYSGKVKRPAEASSGRERIEVERVALSQRLLEQTDQSVERIAAMAGFGSVISMRHHFRRGLGVNPTTKLRPKALRRASRRASRRAPAQVTRPGEALVRQEGARLTCGPRVQSSRR